MTQPATGTAAAPAASIARQILYDAERPLRRMDVFLTRDRKSFVQDVISWCTQCYWAHPAVTFVIPSRASGFEHAFIMESAGEGVDVHNAAKYFRGGGRYDFAILRPKAQWFSGATEEAEDIRRTARGRMLESVDADYDRSTVLRLFWHTLFRPPYLQPRRKRARPRRDRKPIDERALRRTPQEFMCSGFASHAFYRVALALDAKDDGARVDDILFNPMFDELDWDALSEEERERIVLSTTPADLAFSDLLDWKWVVVQDQAHKVDSRRQADEILRQAYGKLPPGHSFVGPIERIKPSP